jgi:hypothetical protein
MATENLGEKADHRAGEFRALSEASIRSFRLAFAKARGSTCAVCARAPVFAVRGDQFVCQGCAVDHDSAKLDAVKARLDARKGRTS